MTTVDARPDPMVCVAPGDGVDDLVLDVVVGTDRRCISVSGDLDLATRHLLFLAATGGSESTIVLDLAGVRFMDCAGYGAVVASANVVEADGRRMTVSGQQGEPARLLELIRSLEAEGTALADLRGG